MDKKSSIIVVLILVLVVAVYFAFQNTETIQQESLVTDVISPSQELRVAYEESSQHSAMADVAELACFPTSRFDCNGESCTPVAPATYYFVDSGTESGTYFRCDAEGCDSYPVDINPSGSFTQFTPSLGQAILFKIANIEDPFIENPGEFVDVATLGTMTIVSHGKCETLK
jgi:hypothetical protein